MLGTKFFVSNKINIEKLSQTLPQSKLAKVNTKPIRKICFSSVLPDYKAEYNFEVSVEMGTKKVAYEKKIELTGVYDDKGYLHRYVVKKILEEVLDSLAEKLE